MFMSKRSAFSECFQNSGSWRKCHIHREIEDFQDAGSMEFMISKKT
jgi:hypothetical protein